MLFFVCREPAVLGLWVGKTGMEINRLWKWWLILGPLFVHLSMLLPTHGLNNYSFIVNLVCFLQLRSCEGFPLIAMHLIMVVYKKKCDLRLYSEPALEWVIQAERPNIQIHYHRLYINNARWVTERIKGRIYREGLENRNQMWYVKC